MYCIEKIGCGAKTRFCVKRVIRHGLTVPCCTPVKSEAAAREQAAQMGIEIFSVGDLWENSAAYNKLQKTGN